MSTASLFSVPSVSPTISFELFPPRTDQGAASLPRTVEALAGSSPDFFSVTYGAGGATQETSRRVVQHILERTDVTPIAHLTCVGASEQELAEVINTLLDSGVRDFLALRGDPPEGQPDWQPHPQGYSSAAELVRLLRRIEAERFGDAVDGRSPVSVSVAAYPGGTYDESGRPVISRSAIESLRAKQEAGADYAITQMFFDPQNYGAFVASARENGIRLPILPGILPLTDPARLRRAESLSGVPVPAELIARLESAQDAEEQYRLGLDATVELVRGVLDAGAPGLHIYTFNTSRAPLDLLTASGLRPAPAHDGR